ncbi:MAG: methylenetetrahydrofolate--tRNA-(uracil(54)-C(5))-methyltransferase (FADH(2)-oxidizing) TrmFO [Clostridia bacterium]|nr:methylenetetrahydrofolate--tRNA-(uracil(54)-C(5))-methyltransferase (FADH(2)-oxidizing) TrmFO [Clostridia bacterium]
MTDHIDVIGAGLAGCEAAQKIASFGIKTRLYDIKPSKMSDAHSSGGLAELVCSNSLKSVSLENASGILKEEMQLLDSIVIESAYRNRVPAGNALAVDRDAFSSYITDAMVKNENIEVICREVCSIDPGQITVIATGPLTTECFSAFIAELTGLGNMYFYDAASPIVMAESIDMETAFRASRYGKGGEDYINCPMDERRYGLFMEFLLSAERVNPRKFEKRDIFEGCMPVEIMASRGYDTLRFGPLKPIGLTDPRTGNKPFAVVQLRTENISNTMYNLVGFQTNLKFGEQKRMMTLIPGLENAKIARYGVMHRNTYINSPEIIDRTCAFKADPNIFFAGQITGVEGYLESAATGIAAGLNAAMRFLGKEPVLFANETLTGALLEYISGNRSHVFQPMNANFGILKPLEETLADKRKKTEMYAERALRAMAKTADGIRKVF